MLRENDIVGKGVVKDRQNTCSPNLISAVVGIKSKDYIPAFSCDQNVVADVMKNMQDNGCSCM